MQTQNLDGLWMMNGWTKDRIYMLVGSLVLATPFFLPVWVISLTAPQYTEPVKMFIHPNGFSGEIQTINILNHYVGMKEIPEHMTEFVIFPVIIVAMMCLGLVVAWIKKYYWIWIVLFLIIASVGIIDFYLWEYDYGHNLDPKAAIKIPGQAYQPPLIGSKEILNFNAMSMPAWGSLGVFLSLILAIAAFYINREKNV